MRTAVIVLLVIILAGGAMGNYLRFNERMPEEPPQFSVIPYQTERYYGKENRFSEASYEVLNADTTTLRQYVSAEGITYWLFVAYFSSQKYGSQIHSPKHCLPGGGWKIRSLEPFDLPLPGGGSKEINRVVIAHQNEMQLMFYWFETRGGQIRTEFGVKWDLMKNSLLLRPTDAAFVRLTLPVKDGGIEEATRRAIAYFNTFHPTIEAALPFNK